MPMKKRLKYILTDKELKKYMNIFDYYKFIKTWALHQELDLLQRKQNLIMVLGYAMIISEMKEKATFARDTILPLMQGTRNLFDFFKNNLPNQFKPFPTYDDLLLDKTQKQFTIFYKKPVITLQRYTHSMLSYKTEMMNKMGKMLNVI